MLFSLHISFKKISKTITLFILFVRFGPVLEAEWKFGLIQDRINKQIVTAVPPGPQR